MCFPGSSRQTSDELDGNAAERAEIRMQRIALLRPDRPREGARQHHVARLQRDVERRELVGEPRDRHRRMAEHTGGKALRIQPVGAAP